MNGENSYAERQTVANQGEELFLDWCQKAGWHCNRIGFDEKESNVPMFFKLNTFMRNIPDFVISKEEKIFVVNVKGTANIKQAEVRMIPLLAEVYSSPEAPMIYAFCFVGETPKFVSYDKVITLYEKEKDKQWSDGKIYRTLTLENKT